MPSSSRHGRRQSGKKRLNVKLLLLLLAIPILLVIVGVTVAVITRGGEGIERLTRRHDPTFYLEKGDALMQEEKYAMAVKQYEKAAHFDSGNTLPVMKIVAALEKVVAKTPEEAGQNTSRIIGLLHRVTQMDPSHEEAQRKLLTMLYDGVLALGQHQLAQELLELSTRFLEGHPERTYALRFKALAQAERMKRRQLSDLERLAVRDDLEHALRIFPRDPALLGGLSMWNAIEGARLKVEKGESLDVEKYEKASEEILRRVLAQSPTDLEAKLQLARTVYAHGNKAEGMQLLSQLETALLADVQPKLAVQVATFILAADTEPVATSDGALTIGGVLRADKLLAAALERAPNNLEVAFTAAAMKKRMGRLDEAVVLLEKAVGLEGETTAGMAGMADRQLRFAATTELANSYLVQAELAKQVDDRNVLIGKAQQVIDKLGREMRSSALVDLLEGKIALLQGNTARAILKFEASDRKFDGRNPEAVFLSAVALKRSGEAGAAITRLERLQQASLGESIAIRTGTELASLYLQTGDLEKADQAVNRVLQMASEDQTALLLKSEIFGRRQRAASPGTFRNLDEAVRLLRPLAEAGDTRARVQLARLYHEHGRLEEARKLLEEDLATDPGNLMSLQQLVQIEVAAGNREQALEHIERAIEKAPENRVLPLLRQQVQGDGGNVEMLEKMLAGLDDRFQSALGLYTLYRNTNREAEALQALARATELKPNEPRVLAARFQEATASQDWRTAQEIAAKAAELDLDEARGAFWLGRLDMARQQYFRAASSFQDGVKRRPLYSAGWRMLGDSHRLSGNLVQAENAYQEALKIKPDDVGALYSLFLVRDARNMYQAALADIERAMQLAPKDVLIANAYLFHLGKQKPEEALARRRQKAQSDPADWRNRLEMARLMARVGEEAGGRQVYRQLLDERPDDLEIVFAVADNHREQGEMDKGRDLLEAYVDRRGEQAVAQDWLVLARFLLACDLSQPAVTAYQEAIRLEDPVQREASRELGDWYFNNQFFAQALPLYEKAFAVGEDSPRLTLRYIETLIYNNKLDPAGELLKNYVRQHGENAQTALLQCIVAIEKKEFDNASQYAETAVRLGPSNPQAYLYRARLDFLKAGQTGSRRGVVRDLEKSLSLDPTLLAAREMLVDCYLSETPPRADRAVEQLAEMVRQKPRLPQSRVRLVQLLINDNKIAEAESALQEAVAVLPDLPIWYSLRATVLQRAGRPRDALADLQKVFELAKTNDNLARLADGFVQAGDPKGAVNLLDLFADDVVKDPVLMAVKGKAQAAAGNEALAQSSFEMAFRQAAQNPAQLQALLSQAGTLMPPLKLAALLEKIADLDRTGMAAMTAGQLLVREGKVTEGIRRLEAVRGDIPRSSPSMAKLMHVLANAYQQIHDYNSAAVIYDELSKLAPKDYIALNNLAFLLGENLQQPERAIEVARKALELAPADGTIRSNVLDTLGWVQFKAGKLDEAQLSLTESVRLEAGLHNQHHLAQVMIARQMSRDARLQLRNLRRLAERDGNAEFIKKADDLLSTLQ